MFLITALIAFANFKHNVVASYSVSVISISFLILALTLPTKLNTIQTYWTKLGLLLKKITSPIILVILFFGVLTPIGILLKLFKKDILNMNPDSDQKSYWIDNTEISSFKDQH